MRGSGKRSASLPSQSTVLAQLTQGQDARSFPALHELHFADDEVFHYHADRERNTV